MSGIPYSIKLELSRYLLDLHTSRVQSVEVPAGTSTGTGRFFIPAFELAIKYTPASRVRTRSDASHSSHPGDSLAPRRGGTHNKIEQQNPNHYPAISFLLVAPDVTLLVDR
jgi:hypothetical protein